MHLVEVHKLEARGGMDFKFHLRHVEDQPGSFVYLGNAVAAVDHDELARAIVGTPFSTPDEFKFALMAVGVSSIRDEQSRLL
jgi:hypothetical protein